MKKERIWELDAFRGLLILGMMIIHFIFDLRYFAQINVRTPAWFDFIGSYGHILFILLSGLCATLSTHSVKRGIIVFAAGLLVSYVTVFLDFVLHMDHLRIWFGILHLLGICMILYPIFRKIPFWMLALLGVVFIALGLWLQTLRVSVDFLFPLGLRSQNGYVGSDYFPIFPGLGWFLIGTAFGKRVYNKKTTLFPAVNSKFILLRMLRFIGRHSLEVYLLHQPVFVIIMIIFNK